MALLALPWSLKPLFGLLSDYVPFLGSRRRGYLLTSTAIAALGLLVLWLAPLPPGSTVVLMLWLLLPTIGIAFGDVLVDALMIERGRPLGMTGRLQSVQWTAAYVALLLTGVTAGYLAEHALQQTAFLLCAVLWAGAFALAWIYARETAAPPEPPRLAAFRAALDEPGLLPVIGMQFLWSLNPLWVSVLYFHLTDALAFSEQVYGNTYSLFSAGCVIASIAYALYCRRLQMSRLLHASILTGIAANAVYWQIATPGEAYVISVIAGGAYMTGMLIQLDLAARVVPLPLAATLFAVIMALSNLAASLSEAVGGYLYDLLQQDLGEPAAYRAVILLSMLCAASCWLLVPKLRRDVPAWWHRGELRTNDD